MNSRHAAALALLGWYLMSPPLALSSSRQISLDLSKPLSEWYPLESYETVADCNKEIDAMNKRAVSQALKHHTMLELSHAQCIASDDPRFKGNPSLTGN
jgi:hypothetical protein